MGIRRVNKDHSKELASESSSISESKAVEVPAGEDPLRFWTKHPSLPVVVDLNCFKLGEQVAPTRGTWLGPFNGRPRLIGQLGPVVRAILEYGSPSNVTQYIHALRTWWRLFDTVESALSRSGQVANFVDDVADISDVHRQRAIDDGMARLPFSNFVRVVNIARKAARLPKHYWEAPSDPRRSRHLPPQWQIDQIRFALKRHWFDALHRWERAEQLLDGQSPVGEEEKRLLKNYQLFKRIAAETGLARPSAKQLAEGRELSWLGNNGYAVSCMASGFYPDATDIRAAFHLCLANTGWNPAVLLDLNIHSNFIEPHPKDTSRYVMYGHKARGNSVQITQGLLKSQGAAGPIILELIKRTAPLREQLKHELSLRRSEYDVLLGKSAPIDALDEKRKEINHLEQGSRSPWLYSSMNKGVRWLHRGGYSDGSSESEKAKNSFIFDVVNEINLKRPPDKKIESIKSTDFRDAFAAYVYHQSGGQILTVMKALGHRRPAATKDYLDNNLLNDESARIYRMFSETLLREIRHRGEVDPTMLAAICRYGSVTDEERTRVKTYRTLKRSRIGVACKDPTHPPKHIAPDFEPDGHSLCPTHRCTLCYENAVILPESLSGLCKRMAELRFIKSSISIEAFISSSFAQEFTNTEFALKLFDATEVSKNLSNWEDKITSGEHRTIDFDGVPKGRL